MKIRIREDCRGMSIITLALFMFSATSFWESNSLNKLLVSGIVVICFAMIIAVKKGIFLTAIINDRVILWLVVNYSIFTIYGFFFLRAGEFNWDFVLFNGVSLVFITIILKSFKSSEQMLDILCTACKLAIIATGLYIYTQETISFSNIVFGSRLGYNLSGNVNTVATCLAIMYLPAFYSAISKLVKGEKDIAGFLCSCFAIIIMLMTGSKKALIVIVISFIMTMYIYRKPVKYVIIPVCIFAGIYMILNVSMIYNTIGYRILDMLATFEIGEAVTKSRSTEVRFDYIILGLRSFWKHPIFGGGMNYFQYINGVIHYSHNNFVEMLNNFGLVGFFVFYGVSFKSLRYFSQVWKNKNQEHMNIAIFCLMFVISKLSLDMAMVSYSSLGIYYLPFIVPAVVMYKFRQETRVGFYERGKT